MNFKNLTYFVFVFFAGISLVSCDLIKDLSYETTPNPLQMHGDSVAISVTVKIPEKGIKKKAMVEVTPSLGNTKLETWKIQGEKATGNGQVITFKPGGTATFTDVVAYDPSMEAADLNISGKIYKGAKEKADLPTKKLADATIITPLLVQPEFKMLFEKVDVARSSEKTATANINFERGKSVVRPNEFKDKDILDLMAWIQAAQSNPKIKINSIDINGYASPDGEAVNNDTLSAERSRSTMAMITKTMGKLGNVFLSNPGSYAPKGFGEDFDGFREQLALTNTLSQEDKDLLVRIIDRGSSVDEREKEMIALGKSFTSLEKEVFPALRRAAIIVNYTEFGPTDEEYKATASSNPSSLTVEELLFIGGKLTSDMTERVKIYDAAAMYYPQDYRALNNAGAGAFLMNNPSKAKTNLEKAITAKDNNLSKNNLAGVMMIQGDRAGAKKLLSQCKDKSSEVSYNNAIIMILEGKYTNAITSAGSEASFNKALAMTLAGQNDEAGKVLSASKDKESADGYYLKAILSARSGAGVDAVVSLLKSSIAKDSSYASKAAKDREFIKYMSDANFTSAIK